MREMKINKQFEVTVDKLGTYVLVQTYKTKVGTMATRETYHPDLEHVFKYCIKMGVAESKLKDVKTVMNKIDEVYNDIEKACKKIKREGI